METNTAKHAQLELEIVRKTVKDSLITPFTDEIITLCKKFGKEGHSGGSAPTAAKVLSAAIENLLLQKPISKLTGISDEWMNVSDVAGDEIYQNKRHPAVFKDIKGAYFLDAIIFKTQDNINLFSNNGAYLQNGSRIQSRAYIKKFPFEPKTFYIDVIEKEIKKDDWEMYVKDEKQLRVVGNYYNLANINS